MRFIERARIYKESKENWLTVQEIANFTDGEVRALAAHSFFCGSRNIAHSEGGKYQEDQEALFDRLIDKINGTKEHTRAWEKIADYMKTHPLIREDK